MSLYEDTTLGVQAIPVENQVSLSPNPADDKITITTLTNTPSEYEINDLLGKKVHAGTMEKLNEGIDTRSIPNGVYLIHFNYANGKSLSKKLIISHR